MEDLVGAMPAAIDAALGSLDDDAAGAEMMGFIARAYPICRSITGDGVRRTLALMGEQLPLAVHEVASGTPVLDWTVPKEWNVRGAWIKDPRGRKVVDFAEHNLHLLGYSVPVRRTLPLAELKEHLFSLPEQPDLIPYRTSYYRETWGFCLRHRQLEELAEGDYEVCIDTTLEDGALTYAEVVLPGATRREVLISCHLCHPSLANDNLSGLAVTLWLAKQLAGLALRYTYRFVYVPGTIGAITWLARNEATAQRVAHGLVAANLGDPGRFCYKKSRRGTAEIDRAALHVLGSSGAEHGVEEFVPFGYDERQYCSPGFNLPVGSLTRTPYGRYPEYHTSADNLDLIQPEALAGSLRTYLEVVRVLEGNRRYLNLRPMGEPQLGRRGLYSTIGGTTGGREREMAMLWVLNLADGEHSLLDIAERSGLPFSDLLAAGEALLAAELLAPASGEEGG